MDINMSNINDVERWLSLEEIAKHVGCSKDTIRAWKKKEQFHITKWEECINLKYQKWMHGLKAARVPTQTNNWKTGGLYNGRY